MNVLDRIQRNRARFADEMQGSPDQHRFSAAAASRYRATRRLIEEHARGRVLDVGAGHMPLRDLVRERGCTYESFDVERRTDGVDHVGDVQDMAGIADAAYDAVLCLEVLEHVPRPGRALAEIRRVLAPGGALILTVPHLARLHEEPHDYYRYTRHGLRFLLEDAGLEVIAIEPHAGLFSFLAHQVSTVAIGLAWGARPARRAVLWANEWTCVRPPLWLDRQVDRRGLFALGYACTARRPG